MNTIEILSRLEKVNFTTQQARTITEIIEDHQHEIATKEDLKSNTDSLKNDLKISSDSLKNDLKKSSDSLKNDLKISSDSLKNDLKISSDSLKNDLKTSSDSLKNDLKISSDSLKIIIDATVAKAKYDLVRWIVGAVIANGLIATLLKFFA